MPDTVIVSAQFLKREVDEMDELVEQSKARSRSDLIRGAVLERIKELKGATA